VQLEVNGTRLQATARGTAPGGHTIIRVEEVKISASQVETPSNCRC
jgi:iron(III) transport system ATP-binding protein